MTIRHNWGEYRAYYHDDGNKLSSIPARWTSVSAADPFVVLAGGRSPFRVDDLLELCRLLDGMSTEDGSGAGEGEAGDV